MNICSLYFVIMSLSCTIKVTLIAHTRVAMYTAITTFVDGYTHFEKIGKTRFKHVKYLALDNVCKGEFSSDQECRTLYYKIYCTFNINKASKSKRRSFFFKWQTDVIHNTLVLRSVVIITDRRYYTYLNALSLSTYVLRMNAKFQHSVPFIRNQYVIGRTTTLTKWLWVVSIIKLKHL